MFMVYEIGLSVISLCSLLLSNFLHLYHTTDARTLDFDRPHPPYKGKLVVISLDGFANNYIKRYLTPTFDRIASLGSSAPDGFYPSFPTKTFPTHISIATGLYEESHGIIDNSFVDLTLNLRFTRQSYNECVEWLQGEPIWYTAESQGISTKISWPGAGLLYKGKMAPGAQRYDPSKDIRARANQVIEWLDNGARFVMAYFDQPDATGHRTGAFSHSMKLQIAEIDEFLDKFVTELEALHPDANIIIISDHGLTDISKTNPVLALDSVIDLSKVTITQSGSVAGIVPKAGVDTRKIINALKKLGPSSIYEKKDIPRRFHYQNNARIAPILVLAAEGYVIQATNHSIKSKAVHGYDNKLPSMRSIFFAKGPYFKKQTTVEPFESVDLYNLFCDILDIRPSPNNGTLGSFIDIKADVEEEVYNSTLTTPKKSSETYELTTNEEVFQTMATETMTIINEASTLTS